VQKRQGIPSLDQILVDHNMNMIHRMYGFLAEMDQNFLAAEQEFLQILREVSSGKIKPEQVMVTDNDYEILELDIAMPKMGHPKEGAKNGKQAVPASVS